MIRLVIGKIMAAVDELLFPPHAICLGCGFLAGINHDWLCDECLGKIHSGVHCVRAPQWPEDGVSRAWFAMYYEPPVSRLVRAFKYRSVYRCAPFIVSLMKPVLSQITPEQFDCLEPVPLFYTREWKRGFNQAEILARLISKETGVPVRCSLRRTRETKSQSRLPVSRRLHNLNEAFVAEKSSRGLRVLLIDDVLTSGTTVNCCAKALRLAGAVDVQALTVLGSRFYKHHGHKMYRKTEKK